MLRPSHKKERARFSHTTNCNKAEPMISRCSPPSGSYLQIRDCVVWCLCHGAGRGEVDESTHPALPEDKETYEVLAATIKHEVASNVSSRFKARGRLKRLGAPSKPGTISNFQVKWDSEP
jgi:hypothetical protein